MATKKEVAIGAIEIILPVLGDIALQQEINIWDFPELLYRYARLSRRGREKDSITAIATRIKKVITRGKLTPEDIGYFEEKWKDFSDPTKITIASIAFIMTRVPNLALNALGWTLLGASFFIQPAWRKKSRRLR